jgi:hypothetical protein
VVLNKGRHGLHRPVRSQRKHSETAAAVIGDQGVLAAAINFHVTWAGPSGWLLVQERQFPGGRVNGEGAEAAGRRAPAFADRIEKLMIRRNGQKGGMLNLRGQADSRKRARGQVEAEGLDVLSARSDEDQFLLGLRAGRPERQQPGERRESEVIPFHNMLLD